MKKEILPINLLRFLASLGVLSVHKFGTFIEIGYLPNFFSFLIPVASYGYLGVNLFFLISGFVIALSSEGRTVRQFISARFIRLFPTFWICLSITTILTILLSNEHISFITYLANATMSPYFIGDYPLIDGSYWTLFVELRFYITIAFIILLQKIIRVSLQKIALGLSFIELLYLTNHFNHNSIVGNIIDTFIYYFGAEYAQYFIAGILFYEIYKNKSKYYNYFGLLICYCVAIFQGLHHKYQQNDSLVIILFITTFFILFLAISLEKINNSSFNIFGKYHKKILITLGGITYPLYLLHDKILDLITAILIKHAVQPFVASMFIFLLLSFLIYIVNKFDQYVRSMWGKVDMSENILLKNINKYF